jgi:hypothetical protein
VLGVLRPGIPEDASQPATICGTLPSSDETQPIIPTSTGRGAIGADVNEDN